jgi:hypothetical protein
VTASFVVADGDFAGSDKLKLKRDNVRNALYRTLK